MNMAGHRTIWKMEMARAREAASARRTDFSLGPTAVRCGCCNLWIRFLLNSAGKHSPHFRGICLKRSDTRLTAPKFPDPLSTHFKAEDAENTEP